MRALNPHSIVVCPPTFGMYEFLGRQARARVVEVPRQADFSVDARAVVQAVQQEGATLVMLPSPNNPTGTLLSAEDAELILEQRCVLVVDEAYIEFAGEQHSLLPLMHTHPNLVVTRTMSKWAGLAGLRVGYALAQPSLTRVLLAIKQPYNVNAAAEAAARAVLRNSGAVMEVRRVRPPGVPRRRCACARARPSRGAASTCGRGLATSFPLPFSTHPVCSNPCAS